MEKFDKINVIPFVDIMLVLLAIVLTTATFVSSGQLDITLPGASTSDPVTDPEFVEIALDKDNVHYLDGVEVSVDTLQSHLATLNAQTRLKLLIDETVPFQGFIALIDMLKRFSLDKVSIQTRKLQ